MNDSKISVRYATALFESAREKELLDRVRNDMLDIQKISLVPEFQGLLTNPVIKESRKSSIVDQLLAEKVHSLTLSFLKLIIRNGREFYIPAIARNYLNLYRKHKGIKSATLITAIQVPEELKRKVEKVVAETIKSGIEMKTETDEDLIGGFIIRIEDRQYDASVSSNLRKMKKTLLR